MPGENQNIHMPPGEDMARAEAADSNREDEVYESKDGKRYMVHHFPEGENKRRYIALDSNDFDRLKEFAGKAVSARGNFGKAIRGTLETARFQNNDEYEIRVDPEELDQLGLLRVGLVDGKFRINRLGFQTTLARNSFCVYI